METIDKKIILAIVLGLSAPGMHGMWDISELTNQPTKKEPATARDVESSTNVFWTVLAATWDWVSGNAEARELKEAEKKRREKEAKKSKKLRTKYSWLFERVTDKYHDALEKKILEKLKDKESWIIDYSEFLDAGGTNDQWSKLDDVPLRGKKPNIKRQELRRGIGEILTDVVAQKEGISSRCTRGYCYFHNSATGEKIMTGKRGDGKAATIQNVVGIEKKKLKEKLAGHYQIQLMPQEKEIFKVAHLLIQALQDDQEMRPLINTFKVRRDLKLKMFDSKKFEQFYPLIVIYPAKGQDNAQKLLNRLAMIFKDVKGIDKMPRFNIKVNDLIYYAQGDGDAKKQPELKQYFDKKNNLALYRQDFIGKDDIRDFRLKVK